MAGGRLLFALGFLLIFAVSAYAYIPNFYYQAEINASYNTQEVVDAAKELGYAIAVEVNPVICRDENWTIYEGDCAGKIGIKDAEYEYINTNDSSSMLKSDKKFYASSNNAIIYNEHNEYFNLDTRTKSTDLWTVSITPKTINFNLEEAKSITLNELKRLKILAEDASLTFEELPYAVITPLSDGQSGIPGNSYLYIIIVLLAITVIIIAMYKRG